MSFGSMKFYFLELSKKKEEKKEIERKKALDKFITSHVRGEKYTRTHLDLWNLSAQRTLK